MNIQDLKPNYITNEKGERVSVVLPIGEFEELMEDFEDILALARQKNEPGIPFEDVVAEMKTDGLV